MQSFELYDRLCDLAKSQTFQRVNLEKICAAINSLNKYMTEKDALAHRETIAALCLHHERRETQGLMNRTVPYGGRVFDGGKGILYNTNNIPPALQQLIAIYVLTEIAEE